MKIAICTIAYNRLDSIKRLLESLSKAYYHTTVTLIISIDKSDNETVVEYANSFMWNYGEKRVVAHQNNLGLKKHILSIGEYLQEFDAIVVLEDDITVAQNFFNYTIQTVEKYYDNNQIAGISLYNYPLSYHNWKPFVPLHSDSDVYLIQVASSWGQIWMKNQWNAFKEWYEDHNDEFQYEPHLPKSICLWGKNSWLKYHMKYCIEENKYFVFPYISLSTNNSDAGTHSSRKNTIFQSPVLFGEKTEYNLNPTIIYDGFFESEQLYKILDVPKEKLCIDFYGCKQNAMKCKYWLTTSICDYKVVKSFSLEQKPYEYNIINNIEGMDIFLYDTEVIEKNMYKNIKLKIKRKISYIEYIYNIKLSNFIKVILKKQ